MVSIIDFQRGKLQQVTANGASLHPTTQPSFHYSYKPQIDLKSQSCGSWGMRSHCYCWQGKYRCTALWKQTEQCRDILNKHYSFQALGINFHTFFFFIVSEIQQKYQTHHILSFHFSSLSPWLKTEIVTCTGKYIYCLYDKITQILILIFVCYSLRTRCNQGLVINKATVYDILLVHCFISWVTFMWHCSYPFLHFWHSSNSLSYYVLEH